MNVGLADVEIVSQLPYQSVARAILTRRPHPEASVVSVSPHIDTLASTCACRMPRVYCGGRVRQYVTVELRSWPHGETLLEAVLDGVTYITGEAGTCYQVHVSFPSGEHGGVNVQLYVDGTNMDGIALRAGEASYTFAGVPVFTDGYRTVTEPGAARSSWRQPSPSASLRRPAAARGPILLVPSEKWKYGCMRLPEC